MARISGSTARRCPGDPRSSVDWRRSGKSDQQFIREMEWEAAQTVSIWVDDAQSMDYRDAEHFRARSKDERASLLALALSVLLIKAGERVALMGTDAAQPRGRPGAAQPHGAGARHRARRARRPDYGVPPADRLARGGAGGLLLRLPRRSRGAASRRFAHAADQGVRGCFVQVLDETEESLPLRRPDDLREHGRQRPSSRPSARGRCSDAYVGRLAERRAKLVDYARHLGWRCYFHRHQPAPPRKALLWLYMAVGERA